MLDNLTSRLSCIIEKLRGRVRLTEANTQDALREIRIALLEADVALTVVQKFIKSIKEKAFGEEVIGNLNPGQALVSLVYKELVKAMGGDSGSKTAELSVSVQPPAVFLIVGLQGTGKTTTTAKLAYWLSQGHHTCNGKKTGKKKVLVTSTDTYRPAAIEQLGTLVKDIDVGFMSCHASQTPREIAHQAMDYARCHHFDVLILDTAGRLGIDTAMMEEVCSLYKITSPIETLFVVDAMQGQDAANAARAFSEALPITGIILTKTDGDTRGGAALSTNHITGKPLKFISSSERIDGFECFYPDRMAKRILGMGDILSIVEKAQVNIDTLNTGKIAKRLKSNRKFDLNDFRYQITQLKNFGGIEFFISKLPAQLQNASQKLQKNQTDLKMRRTEGILNSMTPIERTRPELFKASRKRRIATGAGVSVQDVNQLLSQFKQMQEMAKKIKRGKVSDAVRALRNLL